MKSKKAGDAPAPKNKRPATATKLRGRIKVLESLLAESEGVIQAQRTETVQTLEDLTQAVKKIASQEHELVNQDGRLRAEARRIAVEHLRAEVASAAAEILIIDALFQGTIDANGIGKLCDHISEENCIPLADVASVMELIAKTATDEHRSKIFEKMKSPASTTADSGLADLLEDLRHEFTDQPGRRQIRLIVTGKEP